MARYLYRHAHLEIPCSPVNRDAVASLFILADGGEIIERRTPSEPERLVAVLGPILIDGWPPRLT